MGNITTVRSDTFRIRAYGDSRNNAGKVICTAVCEAIVQRIPDYVDPADAPWQTPSSSGVNHPFNQLGTVDNLTSEANERFGRRFVMKSFRWLTSGEV